MRQHRFKLGSMGSCEDGDIDDWGDNHLRTCLLNFCGHAAQPLNASQNNDYVMRLCDAIM